MSPLVADQDLVSRLQAIAIDAQSRDRPTIYQGIREIERFHERECLLLTALKTTLDKWVSLAHSGDAGNWEPEEEAHVIAARAAIAIAEGRS